MVSRFASNAGQVASGAITSKLIISPTCVPIVFGEFIWIQCSCGDAPNSDNTRRSKHAVCWRNFDYNNVGIFCHLANFIVVHPVDRDEVSFIGY
jgi:hypothetical protein